MQRMKKNKKFTMERRMSSVRLDRDAFKRGVEDVMSFAPLRDAVRSAAGVFMQRGDSERDLKTNASDKRDVKTNDRKSSSR
jgi:hypothetical protein